MNENYSLSQCSWSKLIFNFCSPKITFSPRSTTAGYGASQPQYGAPPSRQYGGNDFGNRSYGTNDYGARPYGGSDYGNRPYGAQQNTYGGPQLNAYGGGQHTYSQEMQPGDNKPYQYNNRGSGRIVGGEILNPLKVHMRGLPYRVTAKEIEQFFSPLQIVEIKTGIMEDGRASGDGIVEFNNQVDAQEALSRDKQSIKSRWVLNWIVLNKLSFLVTSNCSLMTMPKSQDVQLIDLFWVVPLVDTQLVINRHKVRTSHCLRHGKLGWESLFKSIYLCLLLCYFVFVYLLLYFSQTSKPKK